jgi:putative ABC transport system permease protein
LLFGITAHDPATYVSVTALLLFVAMVAALIPARRATKIDLLIALSDE